MIIRASIIIPTYNEEITIKTTLVSLKSLVPPPLEIIVVDGGSQDRTLAIAREYGLVVVSHHKGRSTQMNRGAEEAQGDYLVFVHADTRVPSDLLCKVKATLDKPQVACAAFVSVMKGKKTRWFTSFHNYIKTYYAPFIYRPYHTLFKGLRLLFGDQVIFCRREDFLKVGGFNQEDLVMEEANFCLKMNRLGRIRQLPYRVESSDRRVARWGELKANVIFFLLAVGWAIRVPMRVLARYYRDIR